MQFSKAIIAFTLIAFVAASPIPKEKSETSASDPSSSSKSSSTTKTSTKTSSAAASSSSSDSTSGGSKGGSGSDVLSSSTYNQFQISGPTAGDAETKANALFANIDKNNLGSVSSHDHKVIDGIHDAAENAELKAFNPAIAAASGADADALQNGKIENKVLKLTAEVLALQIDIAQGKARDDLPLEQKKLAKNISLDKAAAGKKSTSVKFDAIS